MDTVGPFDGSDKHSRGRDDPAGDNYPRSSAIGTDHDRDRAIFFCIGSGFRYVDGPDFHGR